MTEPSDGFREELADLAFEEVYRRLEDAVSRLEQGELPLAEAELLYRQGMDLANRCQELLTEAELRITQVGDAQAAAAAPPPANADSTEGDDEWEPPPPLEPDDPSLFDDDEPPF